MTGFGRTELVRDGIHIVAEMRALSQATDDAYMRKIADALETNAYQELAP